MSRSKGITINKFGKYGFAGAVDATHVHVLCSEGVGSSYALDSEGVVFDGFYLGQRMGMTVADLVAAIKASTDTVDLADYIRVFGARLESNFYEWHKRLTEGL